MVRHHMVAMMPEQLREPLEASWYCETFEDLQEWRRWACDRIMLPLPALRSGIAIRAALTAFGNQVGSFAQREPRGPWAWAT